MNQRFSFERPLPGDWGLYGGTFDPIHRGHLYAARQVAAALSLDGVIFLPSGDPPHKAGRVHTPADQRLDMVRLAIESEPDFYYSDYELLRPGPSYSYRTAEALAAMLPAATRLIFIIGGDSLLDMPKWRYPERILRAMPVAAAYRPGTPMPAMEGPGKGWDATGLPWCLALGLRFRLRPSAAATFRERRRRWRSISGKGGCIVGNESGATDRISENAPEKGTLPP